MAALIPRGGRYACQLSESSVRLVSPRSSHIHGFVTQETEKEIRPWLLIMFFHTFWRLFALVFGSLVNDLYFAYHGLMCFLWSVMILLNVYGWLVVWSFFNELTEVSKLEDIAHLKVRARAARLSLCRGGEMRRAPLRSDQLWAR